MAGKNSLRLFSEHKHRHGDWNTTQKTVRIPLVRALAGWVSLKRGMVDDVARTADIADLVIDVGAGSGAYVHWFLGRTGCRIVALDWALEGLKRMPPSRNGIIFRVCADARRLPFKEHVFTAGYSVDTLGHVGDPEQCLDEVVRVLRPGAVFALHSECSDYRNRWPDRVLIAATGRDIPAEFDGHCSLRSTRELRRSCVERFRLRSFFSPAGYLGWLIGYPEKYSPAFKAAGRRLPYACVCVSRFFRKIPVLRIMLRIVNALSNHLELFLGQEGGGSCFAVLEKTSFTDTSISFPAVEYDSSMNGPHMSSRLDNKSSDAKP